MLKPVAGLSSLVTQASETRTEAGRMCDECAALSRRNQFIGVESKDTDIAERSGFAIVGLRSQSFASIVDDCQGMLFGEFDDIRGSRRKSERVHNDDRPGSSASNGLELRSVQVASRGIDVRENRNGFLR